MGNLYNKIVKHKFLLVLVEVILLIICSFSLWYKIFLPSTYLFVAIVLSILVAIQLPKKECKTLLIIQIALLGLFLRNVYYLYTNYAIIPFDDGNWDYALVKFFNEEGRTCIIRESGSSPVKLMEWYSQWPLLHIFAISLSQIMGIDAYYLALIIPSIISIISFLFVYLIVENFRKVLNLHHTITPLSLLIYVVTAESLFWPSQFVHQNMGIMFVTIILYLFFRLQNGHNRKYVILALLFLVSVIITHSFTSFVIVNYLIIFSFILFLWNFVELKKCKAGLFKPHLLAKLANLSLVSFTFLFVWCQIYGTGIWSYVHQGINRLVGILLGSKGFEYLPSHVTYPNVLVSHEITILLIFRDIAIYIPSICGFLFILFKMHNNYQRYTLICSVLAFGSLFTINNFIFRVEVFRVLAIFMPIICTLSALAYSQLFANPSKMSYAFILCIAVLVMASFIGLWGHRFAPIHLYTPSIKPVDVGERYNDFMRVSDFFTTRIPVDDYQLILTDDVNPLARLLSTKDYYKIQQLKLVDTLNLNSEDRILVCSFKDLFMYSYFAGKFSPIDTISEAETVKNTLNQRLTKLNLIFDDGKYRIWVS